MRLLILSLVLSIFTLLSPNVQASNCSNNEYDHNGSQMAAQFCSRANALGSNVIITYVAPRQGLIDQGVRNGTLLFEGIVQNNGAIKGQARLFSSNCGEAEYAVSGTQQGNRIVMHGNAPRRDGNCRITRTRPDTLLFTAQFQQAPAAGIRFDDFPAQAYNGAVESPDLSSHSDARTHRTRLQNAVQGGINFAGDHVLATWGCGSQCLMGAVINARSGFVQFLPGTVCCWLDADENINPIEFEADSDLIILTGLINEQEPMAKYYYDFSGRDFRLIKTQPLVAGGAVAGGGGTANPTPVPSRVRTLSNAHRIASSGARTDVTNFTLINDSSIDFTVNWLDGDGNDKPSEGGAQTKTHPWVSPGESWRVERGARTWESHWFAIVTPSGLLCSFSPRQGETVRVSQLLACNVVVTGTPPPVVQPSCPAGFIFSAGNCVRDVAPTPSCPSGFEFRAGQCQRVSSANPPAGPLLADDVTLTPRVIQVGEWPEGMANDGPSLWIAEAGQRTVANVDFASGRVNRRVKVGRLPVQMTRSENGKVFVLVHTDQIVKSVGEDLKAKNVSWIGECPGDFIASGPDIYVLSQPKCSSESSRVVRISQRGGDKTNSPVLGEWATSMTTFGNDIWVGHARVPPFTLVNKRTLDPLPMNIDRLSVWGLAASDTHVFAAGRTNNQVKDGIIVKIDPRGNNEVARAEVAQLVQNIATDGEFVVTAGDKGTVWVHAASDLRLLRTIRSTAPLTKPRNIIFRNGQLLITNGGDIGTVLVFSDWKPIERR